MQLTALVPGVRHVCTRYRIMQFEPHLKAAGIHLNIEPLEPTLVGRYHQLTKNRRNSIVMLVRKALPTWQTLLLRRSAPYLVYDFDDAVYCRDSFRAPHSRSFTRAIRFRTIVSVADLIFAGNAKLAEEAERRGGTRRVEVVPTCVDLDRYQQATHSDVASIRLVWIGSPSTLRFLERSRDLLEAIGAAVPNAIFRVVSSTFPRFSHLPVEPVIWSEASEASALSTSDIGISCLPDDTWSQGKCGLKLLQYMAAGLPVVANPVGVHRSIVPPSAGFQPRHISDWIDCIKQLAESTSLRREMGESGREFIKQRFSTQVWGPIIAGRLKEAVRL